MAFKGVPAYYGDFKKKIKSMKMNLFTNSYLSIYHRFVFGIV